MSEKLFGSEDIIKLFKKLEKRIDKLECFIIECCSKIPVNIGNGVGLYKRLFNKKWEFKSLVEGDNVTITENENDITISASGGGTITGDPTEVLYFDSSGNVTSDENFVRDEATQQARLSKFFNPNLHGGYIVTDNSVVFSSPYVGSFLTDTTNSNQFFNGISIGAQPNTILGLLNSNGDYSYSVYSDSLSSGLYYFSEVNNNAFNGTKGAITITPKFSEFEFQGADIRKFSITKTAIGWKINSLDFFLPEIDGSSGDVMTTDGAGNITFQPAASSFTCSDLNSCDTDNLPEGSTNLYDKTVVLNNGTGISVSGTYPNFTITNTSPSTVTPAALTKSDDTNVTLTLGGTPATALLQATSLNLGWTGQLGVARGGTNIASYTTGDLIYASGTTTLSKLGIGTANQILRTNAGATDPEWFTPSYLTNLVVGTTSISSGTIGGILFQGAGNVLQQNATNLFWDDTNNRLGIGTNAPTTLLHLVSSGSNNVLTITNTTGREITFTGNDNTNIYNSGTGGLFINNNSTNINNGIFLGNSSGATTLRVTGNSTVTIAQSATAASTTNAFVVIAGAHINSPATVEVTDINFNLARTVQFATGAVTTQRAMRVQAPTYAFVGASTITDAYTLAIGGNPVAGTNATITRSWALSVQAGNTQLVGNTYIGATGVAPTALLNLAAGTATASTAPLKFTSGTNLTTIEAGAVEFDGTEYYASVTGTRQTIHKGRSGSFSGVGAATTVFTVTFGGTQPNTTYRTFITPTNVLSAALFYVTNKTTTTFDVTYLAGLTGTVEFDYQIIN